MICQVALVINRTAKGNECLKLLKGSKGLETELEFCDLHGETELSKYLSITYFILFILFIIGFICRPHVLTLRSGQQVRESGTYASLRILAAPQIIRLLSNAKSAT